MWIVDARRDDGKRFVVRADEKLTAFVELESAGRGCGHLAEGQPFISYLRDLPKSEA